MKFNHQIYFNGKLYKAGEDVPMANAETPKTEKVEESFVEPKVEVEEEVAKAVKKTKKK